MLIGIDTLLSKIENKRSVWIMGNQGAHKTALAYRLAYELLSKRGYRQLISNVPDVWADRFTDLTTRKHKDFTGREYEMLDMVAILDEGGKYITRSDVAKATTGFSRKQNVVWILPSEDKPHNSLCELSVQLLNDFSISGVPVIRYRWENKKGAVNDNGSFYWFNPSEIYGIYSTLAGVQDDGGIIDYVLEKRENIITKGTRSKILNKTVSVPLLEGFEPEPTPEKLTN